MSATKTFTDTKPLATLQVRASEDSASKEEPYRFQHLLPTFPETKYPPLEPFKHEEPGIRALSHENPRSFLANATVSEITPMFGSEGSLIQRVTF